MKSFLIYTKRYSWIIVVIGILSYLFVNYNFIRLLLFQQYNYNSMIASVLSFSFILSAVIGIAVWFIYVFVCYLGVCIISNEKIRFSDLLSGIGLSAYILIVMSIIDYYLFHEIDSLFENEASFAKILKSVSADPDFKLIKALNTIFSVIVILWSIFIVWYYNGKILTDAILSILVPLAIIGIMVMIF